MNHAKGRRLSQTVQTTVNESTESKERKARLGSIVKKLFPKVMQQIFKECVSPRGLQGKYKQKYIIIDLTEKEIFLMEKLPNIDDFTIELCYKILRYENVFCEPSCQWGNVPHESEIEISDDVQRIINATNDVISRKSEDISELYYKEFQKRIQEVLKRVDTYLCQDTSIQLYQTNQSSDIDITDMLQQLALMQQINETQIVDEESENIEHYSRVSRVITDTFPNILRDIIRSKISAGNLYQLCLPHLNSFSFDQQAILNDVNSSNSYDPLDITLIYRLLRQLSLISPPTKGWGICPDKVDIKLEDDVERIRCYRNQLAHRCNTHIGKDEFEDYFDKFRDIGYRIDLNFFQKTNYERLIIRYKTCSMDMQLQIKYKNALKQLENIKLQFEERPIKFFWGESFETSLRNLRTILKDEKAEEGRRKIRVQIIFQNEKDVDTTIDILNSLKDEINKDLSGIEFIVATKGSMVVHVDIMPQLLETDELLQSTLTSFLRQFFKRITTYNTESIDMVVLPVEEFTPWSAPKIIGEPVYIEFDIEAELFESDDKMKEQLTNISDTILKHSNEIGTNNDITATLLPICLENRTTTEESFTQAQTPVKYNLPLSVTLRKQLNIKKSKNENHAISSGINIGNTLVFTDYNLRQLIICNSDGTDINYIPLSYEPYYITEIDSNTVAVSCINVIVLFNLSTYSVTNTIKPSGKCYGISYDDNNLYVVIDWSIIHVMALVLTGIVIRTISLPSVSIDDITVDKNRLIYTDGTSIYRCSLDGGLIWKFEMDNFIDLGRVITDDMGNIYVTNSKTSTVVVVSDDGKKDREILSEMDGLERPFGIYFDKQENTLLVCNEKDGNVFLFDVKRQCK